MQKIKTVLKKSLLKKKLNNIKTTKHLLKTEEHTANEYKHKRVLYRKQDTRQTKVPRAWMSGSQNWNQSRQDCLPKPQTQYIYKRMQGPENIPWTLTLTQGQERTIQHRILSLNQQPDQPKWQDTHSFLVHFSWCVECSKSLTTRFYFS